MPKPADPFDKLKNVDCDVDDDDDDDVVVLGAKRDWYLWAGSGGVESKWLCLRCFPGFDDFQDEARVNKAGRQAGVFKTGGQKSDREYHVAAHIKKEQETGKKSSSQKSPEAYQRQPTLSDFVMGKKQASKFVAAWILLGASMRRIEHPLVQEVLGSVLRASGATSRKGFSVQAKITAQVLRDRILDLGCKKSVVLMVDAGTILRRTFLNFTIAFDRRLFFWRSFEMQRCTSDQVQARTSSVLSELRLKDLFPVAVVSDSASNMVKALKELEFDQADEEDDEADDDDDFGIDARTIIDRTELGSQESFFFHVRCWCHVYQLVIGDVRKGCRLVDEAITAVERVVPLLQGRMARQALETVCASRTKPGEKTLRPKKVHVPAVTRWNSYITSMVSVLEMRHEVNASLKVEQALTPHEIYSMEICAVLFTPLCIANDATQGDGCSILDARRHCKKMREQVEYLLTVNIPSKPRLDLEIGVVAFKKALADRERFFRNGLVELIDFFDPSVTNDVGDSDYMISLVQRYWIDRGADPSEDIYGHVRGAIAAMRVLTPKERSKGIEWWKDRCVEFPRVALMIEDLTRNVLVTEASVERSFKSQSRILVGDRNRLTAEAINDHLMVLANYCKLTMPPAAQQKHENHLTEFRWKELLMAIKEPDNLGYNTRFREKESIIAAMKPGTRLRVAWKENGAKVWYAGMLIAVVHGETSKFTIFYDKAAEELSALAAAKDQTAGPAAKKKRTEQQVEHKATATLFDPMIEEWEVLSI